MVSVCLPSDALLQHLLSYLSFSYLRRGASLHGCSSKVQLLLLILDEGYLLTVAPPDLEPGVDPLGPPAPGQPPLLGYVFMGLPGGTSGKKSTCQFRRCKRHGFDPWVRKMPWRRKWQPTPILLPGKSHGHRRLADYIPWGHKE